MSNEQNRFLVHPDTGENFIAEMMSDEDVTASFSNPQIIRDKWTAFQVNLTAKQADLDELRSAKVAAAIQSLQDDIAAFDTATANQRLAMQKRSMQRQLAVIKALSRLV